MRAKQFCVLTTESTATIFSHELANMIIKILF